MQAPTLFFDLQIAQIVSILRRRWESS